MVPNFLEDRILAMADEKFRYFSITEKDPIHFIVETVGSGSYIKMDFSIGDGYILNIVVSVETEWTTVFDYFTDLGKAFNYAGIQASK